MTDDKPTGIKWTERKWSVPLAAMALLVTYPLLPYLYYDHSILYFFLLGLPAALGVVTAWAGIKRWEIDKSSTLKKYNMHPKTLAFGAGGSPAGLFFILLGSSQAIHYIQGSCDINDGHEITVFALVFMVLLFGQIFWLIWPLAVMKAIWRSRLRLVKIVDALERLIIFVGAALLVPGMIIPIFMLSAFIETLICR